MTLGVLQAGVDVSIDLIRLQVGLDKLDEPVKIFDCHAFVLLIKVIDVAVENLDEQLNGDCNVHAGISNSKGALEAFEHTFAIAVDLDFGEFSNCVKYVCKGLRNE